MLTRQPSIQSAYSASDPLARALRPPPTESEESRQARLETELAAKKVSAQIDEQLRQERVQRAKAKNDVKLLLLGQAESGKSTLGKQFRILYKGDFEAERSSWTIVILQNLVSPIKHILQVLEQYEDQLYEASDAGNRSAEDEGSSSSSPPTRRRDVATLASLPSSSSSPSGALLKDLASESPAAAHPQSSIPPKDMSLPIAQLRMRLSPLVAVEEDLSARLSGGSIFNSGKGVVVRAGWQTRDQSSFGKSRWSKRSQDFPGTKGSGTVSLTEEVGRMLESLAGDIEALWEHPTVRALIKKRKLKLDEWAEFFLTQIRRIAIQGYAPTTDDILHARIQTLGVSEDIFDVTIHGKQARWHLYDVGGARGQRLSWVPYFEGSNAIIFVAPISAFDQYLEEDPRVNRIDDSLTLFTSICSNPLLKDVHLVLFLNKTDLLHAKLNEGLSVKKYITSFGDRPNKYEDVVQYFRAHFLQAHHRTNEAKRVLYTHLTSCVDTKTTQSIIGNVRDSVFRGYLKSAALV